MSAGKKYLCSCIKSTIQHQNMFSLNDGITQAQATSVKFLKCSALAKYHIL